MILGKRTKNHTAYFFAFFSLISSLIAAQKKFTIVLDPGHGGRDIGAHRTYSELGAVQEKDVTLAVVLKLGAMLERNKDFKVIYTRKFDEYPSLLDRTELANRSKADLFISIHCNSSGKGSQLTNSYGTEIYVQGPDQNATNLEVAKRENDVVLLDERDKERFAGYDPTSQESLIALKISQAKYLQASLAFGGLVDDNFIHKDHRYSRGVFQKNLHVLRMNAMPSVLIETGFINNSEDAHYLASEHGQEEIAASVYDAILRYKSIIDKNHKVIIPDVPSEAPLKNDFRILVMSSPSKYNLGDPALKGLNYITTVKENGLYKYYYGTTNLASVRDANIKTAKDAGFKNAVSVGFVPNQTLAGGFYRLELAATKDKLSSNSYILSMLRNVDRQKENGIFYYTYGNFRTLEDAVKAQKELDAQGIKNTAIEKVLK